MIIGVFMGFLGETIFSLIMGMYHYRFDNLPLWVGFAHSLIFTSVYKSIKLPFIKNNEAKIKPLLVLFAIVYSSAWLYFKNDWFGFIMTLIFLLLLKIEKRSQLFFLVMFAVVCYIEIIGTATLTWYWPSTFMGVEGFISSANPPSGIAVFYFLFDFAVLFIYLQLNKKLKYRWKNIQKL